MEAIYAILHIQSTRACVGNTATKEILVALSDLVQGAASAGAGPPVSILQNCMACMGLIAGWRNFAKRQITGQALSSWVLLTRMVTLLKVIAYSYLPSLCS